MRVALRIALPVVLALGLASLPALAAGRQEKAQPAGSARPQAGSQPVPPYHASAAAARPLPRTMPASDFRDRPLVARAYQIASEIPAVLAQQPCYCHCDREFGHTSLLDCFTSTHTAGCGICMGETFFTYQMTREGKSPAAIRQAIIRGDWKTAHVDPFK